MSKINVRTSSSLSVYADPEERIWDLPEYESHQTLKKVEAVEAQDIWNCFEGGVTQEIHAHRKALESESRFRYGLDLWQKKGSEELPFVDATVCVVVGNVDNTYRVNLLVDLVFKPEKLFTGRDYKISEDALLHKMFGLKKYFRFDKEEEVRVCTFDEVPKVIAKFFSDANKEHSQKWDEIEKIEKEHRRLLSWEGKKGKGVLNGVEVTANISYIPNRSSWLIELRKPNTRMHRVKAMAPEGVVQHVEHGLEIGRAWAEELADAFTKLPE